MVAEHCVGPADQKHGRLLMATVLWQRPYSALSYKTRKQVYAKPLGNELVVHPRMHRCVHNILSKITTGTKSPAYCLDEDVD